MIMAGENFDFSFIVRLAEVVPVVAAVAALFCRLAGRELVLRQLPMLLLLLLLLLLDDDDDDIRVGTYRVR